MAMRAPTRHLTACSERCAGILLASLVSINVCAQDVSLSLSPRIDSLNAQLLRTPGDESLKQQLIDAYTLAFQPELALLEILNAGPEGSSGPARAGVRGRVQFSLEQIGPATRSLQLAYLEEPSDETLMLVAVLKYASGDPKSGFFELKRLRARMPSLAVELLKLYERFYLNDRTQIAAAARLAIQDVDPVAAGTYFPSPLITILSPSDGFSTEAHQTSVVWEVRHNRPLKNVLLGDHRVYDRPASSAPEASADVRESFTRLAAISEGRNALVVIAEDIFGNVAVDTVVVNGLSFGRRPEWNSVMIDSLRTSVQTLRNYVDDSVLVRPFSPGKRALLLGGPARDGARTYADRALFLHEFLSNTVTGDVSPDQSKLLIGDRVIAENISLLMDDWLLKGATFQSVSVLYFGGTWRISEEGWSIRDSRGTFVNLRSWLLQLRSLATAGVVLILDGEMDGRAQFEQGLRELVGGSSVQVSVAFIRSGALLERDLLNFTVVPEYDSLATGLRAEELGRAIPGSVVLSGSGDAVPFALNPAAGIRGAHSGLLSRLTRSLAGENVARPVRDRILRFSRDWRRFGEVARYLDGRLPLPDFVVRVEEYFGRKRE